jgi:hypothetical protein
VRGAVITRFRDGEFSKEEPKNPKSKNLFRAEEISLSPKKLGLDTLKIVSRLFFSLFFSLFSFFSFFLQIKVRQRLYV